MIGDAVDQPSLSFSVNTIGMASWLSDSFFSRDGIDAAVLDMPLYGDQGSISTFIGAASAFTVSFWYRDLQNEFYPTPAVFTFSAGPFSSQYQSTTWTNIRVSLAAGNYQLTWSADAGFAGGGLVIDQLEIIPAMGDAVDQPTYTFVPTTSNATWTIGTTTDTHDGIDSAVLTMPSLAPGSREGRLSTTVTGPVDVSFWYVSTSGSPRVSFQTQSLTNDYQSRVWTNILVSLTAGVHALTWRGYATNVFPGSAQRVILDQFVFAFPPGQPALGVAPKAVTNTFEVDAPALTNVFTVAISSLTSMPYTITSDVPWLSPSPSSGSSAGQTNSHGAVVNTALLGYGDHTGRLTVTASGTLGSPTTVTIVARATISLSNALDNSALTFVSGPGTWFGQTNVTHDGLDSAQSGQTTNSGTSRMQTIAYGPGTISFWWKTSSETNNDRGVFRIDNVTNAVLSGSSAWSLVSAAIPDGYHSLFWEYAKNASLTGGMDAAWVDEMVYERQGPTLRLIPAAITNVCGLGGTAVSQAYEISNTGTGVLQFALSTDAAWIVPQPAFGSITGALSSFQSAFVTNIYQTDALLPGVYTGRVTVSSPGSIDSPAELVVVMHVLASTQITFHVSTSGLNQYPFSSWTTASTNIQGALNRAPAATVVLVSDGTYHEYISVSNATILQSANGPANCVIKANTNFVFSQVVTLLAPSVLEGFSVVGSTNDSIPPGTRGVAAASNTTVRRCIIRENRVYGTYGSAPGFGCMTSGPSSCLSSGGFAPGDALGGGIYCDGCVVESCLVYSNAVWTTLPGAMCLTNCMTTYLYGAARGGGIYARDGSSIRNSTIVNNLADTYNSGGPREGGGLYAASSNVLVINSIVVLNRSSSMSNVALSASSPVIFHSMLTPVTQDNQGNLDANAQFEAVSNGNFRLQPVSPGINAGTNQEWMPGTVDLDGHARISGGLVDMGAYELPLAGPVGDVDGDGLPDEWERQSGLFAYASNQPGSDVDGDGSSDAAEYIADTQPTNGLSIFPRIAATAAAPGVVQLKVDPTSTARIYSVYRTDSLTTHPQTWMLVPPEITGTGGAISFSVTNDAPARAYRTGVRLP